MNAAYFAYFFLKIMTLLHQSVNEWALLDDIWILHSFHSKISKESDMKNQCKITAAFWK